MRHSVGLFTSDLTSTKPVDFSLDPSAAYEMRNLDVTSQKCCIHRDRMMDKPTIQSQKRHAGLLRHREVSSGWILDETGDNDFTAWGFRWDGIVRVG